MEVETSFQALQNTTKFSYFLVVLNLGQACYLATFYAFTLLDFKFVFEDLKHLRVFLHRRLACNLRRRSHDLASLNKLLKVPFIDFNFLVWQDSEPRLCPV